MWSFALIGPILLLLGLLSFVLPMGGLQMHGRPVTTLFDKILWVTETALLTVSGIWFALWHVRHMRRDRLMPPCPTCNTRVHPDAMGLCDGCGQQVAPAVHLTEREKRERTRVVLLFIAIMTAVGLLTQVKPIVQRMQPGYGQRFRTIIRVMDADDEAKLWPILSTGRSRRSQGYNDTYSSGAGEIVVNWRYPGEPLVIEVSSKGYERVRVELTAQSRATITLRLKRVASEDVSDGE
jgi:hypothetical protein